MNNVISINKTGKMHINDSKGCDDAVYVSTLGDVICVADGVSNSELGGIGAKALVKSLGQYFSTSNIKRMLENSDVDYIRLNVCTMIERIIKSLCQKHKTQNRDAFSSTFLALIKTSDNKITVLHAGDGCIIGQPKTFQENSISIISCPDNSPSGKVYSAGHIEQKNRMRVFHLNSNDYRSILLCTDGFSDPYLDPTSQAFDMQEFSNIFQINSESELEYLVSSYHIDSFNVTDDISCVVYRCEDSLTSTMTDESTHSFESFKAEPSRPPKNEDIQPTHISDSKEPKKETADEQKQSIPIEKRKAEKNKTSISPIVINFFVCLIPLLLILSSLFLFYSEIKELKENIQYTQKQLEELSNEYAAFKNQIASVEHEYSETNDEDSVETSLQQPHEEITEPQTNSSE